MAKITSRRKTTSRKATPANPGGGEPANAAAALPATAHEASTAPPAGADAGGSKHEDAPTFEEIAARAYERYRARGGSSTGQDQDLDDWFEAERQLREERRR
jgi:hypothetical protein